MSKNLVKFQVDLNDLPPLTDEQEAELAALGMREIDYSDIPPAIFTGAERGRFFRPTKTSTTVRIDSDVLAWLRSQGAGYQTRLNAILRRAMLSSQNNR